MKIGMYVQGDFTGSSGGVEQFSTALISALGRLEDSPEQYIIFCSPVAREFLTSFAGDNTELVSDPAFGAGGIKKSGLLGRLLKTAAIPCAGMIQRKKINNNSWSETLLKNNGIDVIHFPGQYSFVASSIPSIYNPHDLQHCHYPEYFHPYTLKGRKVMYETACRNASAVAVGSEWIKQDVITQYSVPAERIHVIPLAAPLSLYVKAETSERERNGFPGPYALYSASTWPHKNHINLVRALRDHSLDHLHIVCTGAQTNYFRQIQKEITDAGLSDRVHFTGFVSPAELDSLLRGARFVIIPSLFEAGSFPMMEAWEAGVPVACAQATALPEAAGDAALLFDPHSVESIFQAMVKLATDESLRTSLVERGQERSRCFTWEKTALAYRALYRQTAGRELTGEDKTYLNHSYESCTGKRSSQ